MTPSHPAPLTPTVMFPQLVLTSKGFPSFLFIATSQFTSTCLVISVLRITGHVKVGAPALGSRPSARPQSGVTVSKRLYRRCSSSIGSLVWLGTAGHVMVEGTVQGTRSVVRAPVVSMPSTETMLRSNRGARVVFWKFPLFPFTARECSLALLYFSTCVDSRPFLF